MTFRTTSAAAVAALALLSTACEQDSVDAIVDESVSARSLKVTPEDVAGELAGEWMASSFTYSGREIIGSDEEELDVVEVSFDDVQEAAGNATWVLTYEEGTVGTFEGTFEISEDSRLFHFRGQHTIETTDRPLEIEKASFSLVVTVDQSDLSLAGNFMGKKLRLTAGRMK